MHGSPGVRSGLINGVVSVDILQKLSSEFRCEFLVSFASVFFLPLEIKQKAFFLSSFIKTTESIFSPFAALLFARKGVTRFFCNAVAIFDDAEIAAVCTETK